MKLTWRFLLLILSLLAAVGACVVAGTSALTRLDVALQHVVNEDMDRLLSITHARRVFRSMTRIWSGAPPRYPAWTRRAPASVTWRGA